ncbi:putative secreted protein (Por secretion system target) [Sediminitomix flava]|uniref:Putative secreted protein (Por secretion system target) n=1 Tax=Sediminitomix flava TaxID=379075 RepID=A0A315Z9U0_SEDFL|nr:putative secreted protein (Por secretion system target) [Sediminitomix flava]
MLCLLSSTYSLIAQDELACNCDIIVPAGTTTINGDFENALSSEFAVQVSGGETICLSAGDYPDLNIKNLKGTAENPITIINCGGKVRIGTSPWTHAVKINNTEHLRFSGTGVEGLTYGIEVTFLTYREVIAPSGIITEGQCQGLELDHLEIHNTPFAGIIIKYDPKCFLEDSWQRNYLMQGIRVHDNWIYDTGSEGLYIGYTGGPIDCDAENTIFPHKIENVQIYKNLIQRTGWDALQVYQTSNCDIYENVVEDYGFFNELFQNTGIDIGWKTSARIYNNKVNRGSGIGIEIKAQGGIEVFNNQISNAGFDGIYANDVDTEVGRLAYRFTHNTIVKTGRYGIRLENFQTDNQAPNSLDLIANNLITEITPSSVSLSTSTSSISPSVIRSFSTSSDTKSKSSEKETRKEEKEQEKEDRKEAKQEWKEFKKWLIDNKAHWKNWVKIEMENEIDPQTQVYFTEMLDKYKTQRMTTDIEEIQSKSTFSTLSIPFINKDYIYTARPFNVDTLGNCNHVEARTILFTDTLNGDFSLQIGSPAMDICPTVSLAPNVDINGEERISGSAADAGAIELQQYYVEVENSLGEAIEGTLKIYDGSTYQTYESPLTGKWILPKTQTYSKVRLIVNNGQKTISNPFKNEDGRFFQTIPVSVSLLNSDSIPLEGGRIQHAGGETAFDEVFAATDTNGTSSLELLPATYKFRMTYAHGSEQKNSIKIKEGNQNVIFQTVNTQLALDRCEDETRIAPQAAVIYKGFDKSTTPLYTDSNGEVYTELLPDVYNFWVTANDKTIKFSKVHVDLTTPFAHFPLSKTQFLNDGLVQFKAGGEWYDLPEEGIELIEGNYRFRTFDTNGVKTLDQTMAVSGCAFIYDNLPSSPEIPETSIYPQPANTHIFVPMIPQLPDEVIIFDINSNIYPVSFNDISFEGGVFKINLQNMGLNNGLYILQWSIDNQSSSETFMIQN